MPTQIIKGDLAMFSQKLHHFPQPQIGFRRNAVDFKTITGTEDCDFVNVGTGLDLGDRGLHLEFGNAEFFSYFNRCCFVAETNDRNIHYVNDVLLTREGIIQVYQAGDRASVLWPNFTLGSMALGSNLIRAMNAPPRLFQSSDD